MRKLILGTILGALFIAAAPVHAQDAKRAITKSER